MGIGQHPAAAQDSCVAEGKRKLPSPSREAACCGVTAAVIAETMVKWEDTQVAMRILKPPIERTREARSGDERYEAAAKLWEAVLRRSMRA